MFMFPLNPCIIQKNSSSILILGGEKCDEFFDPSFMRVDVNTMKLTMLESIWNDYAQEDHFLWNQSVEWNGKVYMLGNIHIHVISKDCKNYECMN